MTPRPQHQALFFIILILFWVGTTEASKIPRPVWRTRFLQKINYASREGLTGDPCTSSSECASGRSCNDIDDEVECSSSASSCFCVPTSGPVLCTSSSDCVSGEGCLEVYGVQVCFSCDAVGNSDGVSFVDDASTCSGSGGGSNGDDDSRSNVCVSAIHLLHLKSSELVFAEHRRASVLCDSHGSCATPGHMIVYQSQTMTMSRYCSMLSDSCHKRVMLVNSPRMQYGLRINSFTKGLEFTPLAAKYETKLEEAVLKILVRFGM